MSVSPFFYVCAVVDCSLLHGRERKRPKEFSVSSYLLKMSVLYDLTIFVFSIRTLSKTSFVEEYAHRYTSFGIKVVPSESLGALALGHRRKFS